jgi:hypothetical protein
VPEADLLQQLVNYGLAGIVIYMLFKLIYNDLRKLDERLLSIKHALEDVREELRKLREELLRASSRG